MAWPSSAHRRVSGAGIHTTLDRTPNLCEVAARAGTPEDDVARAPDFVRGGACVWFGPEGRLEQRRLVERVALLEPDQLGALARLAELRVRDCPYPPRGRRGHRLMRAVCVDPKVYVP